MFFQPYLIVSGSLQKRKLGAVSLIKKIDPEPVKANHPDLIVLDSPDSIGIREIRLFQKKISLKPFQAKVKVAVIPRAEKLTVPSQNALLKILEEPPGSTLIFLLAPKKEDVLPTIVSRCQIVRLPTSLDKPAGAKTTKTLQALLGGGAGERLKIAEGLKNREAALEFVGELLILWRQILFKNIPSFAQNLSGPLSHRPAPAQASAHPDSQVSINLDLVRIIDALRQTEKSRQLLKANVNPQLVLDNLFLSYPAIPSPRDTFPPLNYLTKRSSLY